MTVDWATSDGTATAGADYIAANGTVTFMSSETSQTISVSLIDDSDDEPAETFIVTLSNPTNVEIVEGRIIQATGTIEDDDLPTVTVAARESEIEEGEPAVFVLTRTGDLTVDLGIRFPYRQHVDQTWGNAYFAVGVATTEVSLETEEDTVVNYPSYREYEVELRGDGSYGSGTDQVWKKGSPARAVVKANDDERLTVVTVEAEQLIVGAGEYAVFIYRRTGDLSEPLNIRHLTYFHSPSSFSTLSGINFYPYYGVTFDANEAEYRLAYDSLRQGTGRTMVLHGDGERRGFHRIWKAGDPSSATVVGADEALVLSTQVPATAGKGETINIEFEVTNKLVEDTGKPIVIMSDRSELTCTIEESISPGNSANCEGSLTITDEDVSAKKLSFSVFATDSTNTSLTLYFQITVRDGATVGFKETGELRVPEGPGAQAELTVTVTGGRRGAVDVAFSLHPNPKGRNLPTPGLDYTDTSDVLTFASDETEKTIIIPILEDEVDEPQERFEVRLTVTGDVKLDPDRATRTVAIQDRYRGGTTDPYIPTMTLHRQDGGFVREDAGVVELAVRLDRPSGHDIQGTLTTNNTGTAEHLSDYQMDPNDPTNGANNFRILSGATETVVRIAIFDDEEEEGNETFPVVLNTEQVKEVKIGTPNEVSVTIVDNDPPSEGIELDSMPPRLSEEGGSQTVEVSATLDGSALLTDTTIRVEDASTGDAVAGVDYETFSAFDIVIPAYSTTATHTFQIVVFDDYLEENQEAISLVGSVVQGDEEGSGVGMLLVTGREIYIDDTDEAAVTVFPLLLRLEENGDGRTYTVVLATEPTDTVTVEVTVREATSETESDYMVVNPTRLTFTPRNWNEEQTVTVYAEDDGDADSRTNIYGYIDHTVSGAEYEGIAAPGVWIVSISETTVPELTVTPVRVSESAGKLEFTLTLNTATVGNVGDRAWVDWQIAAGTATGGGSADDEGADFKLKNGRKIFGHGETEATISTDLYDDDVDEPDEETLILTLTTPHKAKFPGDASTIEVTGVILDDDPPPVLSVTGPGDAPYQVSEADGSITLTITLTGSHSRVVTVDYSTGPLNGGVGVRSEIDKLRSAEEGMDYAGVEGTIEFQRGEKTKTVTIPIINDEVSELTEFFGFLVSNPANAEFARGSTGHRTGMAILDNDMRRVEVTPLSLTLDEGETDGTSYMVNLSSEPTGNVTVDVTLPDGSEVSAKPVQLTFTIENWGTPQTVTLSAEQDDDAVNDFVAVTHVITGADYQGIRADTVTVTVEDDDTQGITLSKTELTVVEGQTGEYTVKLDTQPTDEVTIAINPPVLSDVNVEPSEITFTADNWSTEQTVTVSADHDSDDEDDNAVLTHTARGADYAGLSVGLQVTVDDDAPASLTVSFGADRYAAAEGGSVTVTVNLDADPERTVVIPVTHTPRAGATGADYSGVPATVTFDSGDTSKTFSFRAAADTVDDDDEEVLIRFGTLPTGVSAGTVKETLVSITDDDDPEVKVSFGADRYTASEGGTVEVTVEVTVTLDEDPERMVVIPLTATGQDGATSSDYSGVPQNVTFNSGDTSKTFSFRAAADTVDDDGERVKLTFGALPTGVSAGSVKETLVSITDDDDPEVEVSFAQSTYDVAEGADRTVNVTLSADPERTVVITISAANQGDASSADYSVEGTVTFDAGETAKEITFTATQDDIDDDGESVLLAFGALPSDVSAGTVHETVVSITDDDAAGVTIDPTTIGVVPGLSNEYTVVLASEPTGAVTVTITGHAGTDLSLDKTVLTFTADDWDTAQTVKVTATAEATAASVTLSHSVSGGDYVSVPADPVTVTIVEVSAEELTIQVGVTTSDQVIAVPEGGSNTYSLLLSSRPASNVTISVSLPTGNDLSIDTPTLTFTTTNWATPQTVTITASEDDDAVTDDAVLITHTMISGGSAVIPSVRATITEKDTAEVVITPTPLAVTEGEVDGATYTVALASEPTGDVTVTISGHSGTDLSLDKNVLTFTADDWDSPQTVKVTAAHDDDAVDDPETLTHTASGADYDSVSKDLPVTITDDAPTTVAVSWAQTTYSVAEGGAVTVTAELDDDPEKTVVVPIARTDQGGAGNGDYSGVPITITFTAGDTSKSFTFTATQDDIDDDGESVQLAFGPTLPSGVTQGTPAGTLVRITDDDDPQVKVSFGADRYAAAEGGSVTVTVKLDADPERTVVIPVTHTARAGATSADYSGVPESVTFDSGETAKEITFTATQDDIDDDGESVLLGFGSSLPDRVTTENPATATVTIDDDDDPEVEVSFAQSTYDVAEGADRTVNVTLSADPERTVVITISAANQGDASSADYSVEGTVTFDAGETAKEITFTATQDDIDDDGESVLLAFGALPSDVSAGTVHETVVSITDDDAAGVTIDPTTIGVVPGLSNEYTVVLASEPTGAVTVTITGHAGTDLSLDKTVLTFTADDWDTAQTVKVTATAEATAASVTLSHSVSGGDYVSVPADPVTVTIVEVSAEELTIQVGVTTSDQVIAVPEGGSNTYSLLLSSRPASNVTISVSLPTGNDLSIDTPTLTFTTTNWATPQTVTITASEDDDAVTDDAVLITHTMISGGSAVIPSVRATITEKDTAEVVITPTPLAVTEGEVDGATYTVALASEPTGDVTVTISGHSGTDLSLDKNVLTFTADDWDSPQTVKVTAAHDDDAVDDPETLTHTASGADYDSVSKDLPVTITDDAPTTVAVSWAQTTYSVAEGGAVTVTAELDDDPEKTVVVPIARTDQGGAGNGDYSGVPITITFTAGDTSKSFTFTATQDDIDDDGESVQLAFGPTLPSGVTQGTPAGTLVRITDDDDPQVKVSFGADRYAAAEGGSVTVTVKLDADPERTVVIPVTHTHRAGATGADYSGVPESVTFDSGETAKEITFTATQDDIDDDGESVVLGFGSSLPDRVTTETPATATVTIDDDDDPEVEVSFAQASHSVAEGSAVTVNVTLSADPERTVVITISATSQGGATDADYSVEGTVTFDVGETAKEITFSATQDDIDDDGESVVLAFGALPSDVSAGTVHETVVSITDDDAAGVTIDPTTIGVVPGLSNEYTVVLASEPTGAVTVTITGHAGTDLSLDKTVLTFTADDWDTAQTVKVTATAEATAASVTLSHSVSGGDYASVPADPVTVTIVEVSAEELTIQVGVTTSEQVIAVPEGGSNTYSLLLSSRPASNVTISVSLPTGNDLSIDLLTLTFTTTNWATPQTVTITASEDDDAVTDDAVLITHTMISGGSAVIPSVRATITEKDTAEVVITPTPLAVTEGEVDGATYTVALASEPTGDVTVTISGHSGTDLSLDKNVLTFTADDWDSPQTVKVTAAHDDDAVDDPETLTHTASGADYDSVSKDLPVTITDDAPTTVTVSFGADRYTVAEGGTVEVTVTLDEDPERTVVIPVTAAGQDGATSSDYSGVPSSVTFESGETSKDITFSATDDTIDDDGERVKLAFGTLPSDVSAGTVHETVVSITDDDLPATVTVSFGQSTYTATEGGDDAVVTVILGSPAKRQVEIPLTANGHDGATEDDWSGVPETVSFDKGDTSKSFTVKAFDDNVEDNGEMVELGFGTLPAGFAPGSPSTARITLMNDDGMGVGETTGQNRVCTKGEITVRGQTDRWGLEDYRLLLLGRVHNRFDGIAFEQGHVA